MDLREVGYDDRDWINLAQDRDRWRAYKRRGCMTESSNDSYMKALISYICDQKRKVLTGLNASAPPINGANFDAHVTSRDSS
ncbi:hypothetical protein ANN_16449 [Periplaneta americana]|uniref:Uncharacterized protein n=1 Tax=Periplaneta americana TaxID=6978 RepID=A0ABQ8SJ09_PERAM|nr:hypothetical protein ANN_16449 [Periplaneta americana]